MTNQTANPYAVLGVPPTASAAQVREAYRRMAKQFHPDQNRDAQATERMKGINQAWEMLSSPAGRARYAVENATAAAPHPHWAGAPRQSRPQYGAQPTWAGTQAPYAADFGRDDDASPLRWGLVLLAVPPAAVLLTALFGALVPLPIIALVLFIVARALLRSGD
jgi:molecular chaperone DnaJ